MWAGVYYLYIKAYLYSCKNSVIGHEFSERKTVKWTRFHCYDDMMYSAIEQKVAKRSLSQEM